MSATRAAASPHPGRAVPAAAAGSPARWHPLWTLVIVALLTFAVWWRGGGDALIGGGPGWVWLAVGQVSGLVAALAALVGLVVVARPRRWERRVGLDRMIRWHRVAGITAVVGLLLHAVASTVGFAGGSPAAAPAELWRLLVEESWMVAAVMSAVLFVTVGLTSWRRIKASLPYETWYYLHLNGYLAVLLGFGHQIVLGQTFLADPWARAYWIGLYVLVAAVVLWSRVGGLMGSLLRERVMVGSVQPASRGTVAITLIGPGVRRFTAAGGQFVSVRFATRQLWWQSHPFSLSAEPDGSSLRLTVKNLGDATSRFGGLLPGTRVFLEGPYGCMTISREPSRRLVLIGAGVGLAPMVALLQSCGPWQRPVVLARGHSSRDIPHLEQVRSLTEQRGGTLYLITGPRSQWRSGNPFTAANLRSQIPDLSDRAAFVCGPPALQSAAESGLRRAGMPGRHIHSERFGW